jgi:hypothetical protein
MPGLGRDRDLIYWVMVYFFVLGLLAVLMPVGVVLLVVGVVGRRVDDHPLCRGCGFDLVGTALGSAALCPECGRSVGTGAGRRVGNRVRRRGMMLGGGVAVTAALGIGIPMFVVPLLSNRAARPTWWLLVEAEYGSGAMRDAAAVELLSRHGAGTLAAADGKRLVVVAAEVHSNKAEAWSALWRGCLEDPGLFAMLPEAQRERVAVNGVEPFVMVRERVRSGRGTVVPCGIGVVGSDRVLAAQDRSLEVRTLRWRIEDEGGRVVASREEKIDRFGVGLVGSSNAKAWRTYQVSCDLGPGRYSIVVDLDAVVANQSQAYRYYEGVRPPLEGPSIVASLRDEFEAMPEGEATVEVVEVPELLGQLRGAMRVGAQSLVVTQPRPAGEGMISPGWLQVSIDVVWDGGMPNRVPEHLRTRWKVSLWRADGSAMVPGVVAQESKCLGLFNGETGDMLRFQTMKRVEPGKYKVRFVPDVEDEERSSTMSKLLGGEMEFEVEVKERR